MRAMSARGEDRTSGFDRLGQRPQAKDEADSIMGYERSKKGFAARSAVSVNSRSNNSGDWVALLAMTCSLIF
jgi:hypothetical protein